MRSIKDSPGSLVTFTIILSESTRVPPVQNICPAAFPYYRGGFSGDGRFVDTGYSLNNFAVSGNEIPSCTFYKIPFF